MGPAFVPNLPYPIWVAKGTTNAGLKVWGEPLYGEGSHEDVEAPPMLTAEVAGANCVVLARHSELPASAWAHDLPRW